MSKLLKAATGLAGVLALTGVAQAGNTSGTVCVTPPPPPPSCTSCDGPRTGHSTLPPLSSYFEHQARCVAKPQHVPVPSQKPVHRTVHSPDAYPAVVYKYKPTVTVSKPDPCTTVITKCETTVVKKVGRVVHPPVVHPPVVRPPVIRPPVVHPPVVRPPVVHPPVIHPPVIYRPPVVRVVRPIVPVPYPVPVPVTYPVYAPCPTGPAPCHPRAIRSSRYGSGY
ncbi:hypothetical protein ACFFUB_07905 [Algimonas porphyrae]|uniref:hypothetical protein n=1 Tax=Algimonas porphyrae TaxID=1128113 RepID=UPI0024E08C89|nr:hypothetical protein [Algimonas porphyrae]